MNSTQSNYETLMDMNWRALRFFNLYRFVISLLFVTLTWVGQLPSPLGSYNASLFSVTIHGYLLASLVFFWSIQHKQPSYDLQVNIHVLFDIIMIGILMYASYGLSSGFGMLLVIAIAGGSILKAGRIAILYAAIAAIFVLSHELYIHVSRPYQEANYIHAGFLGITFFITAILGRLLAARVEKTEALAKQHAIDLASLSQLNEHIVKRMQSGIMVLDENLNIKLINESCCRLLHFSERDKNRSLKEVEPEIARKIESWLKGEGQRIVIFTSRGGTIDIQLSFTQLEPDTKFGILVFVDDVGLMRQRAQHLKLASLGRMAASIAHEVRNPLGAIAHASQLISESVEVTEENARLLEIIHIQSQRVNTIIKNVQELSQRRTSNLQEVNLSSWLEEFLEDFQHSKETTANLVNYRILSNNLRVKMDPDQMYQVVSNLLENAILHGMDKQSQVEVECGKEMSADRVYVDIIDHGPGIPTDSVQHLFEPFFTTHSEGTGLGLYIAKELCEANQASLSLRENSQRGCCFRIQFAHIDRQHNLIE